MGTMISGFKSFDQGGLNRVAKIALTTGEDIDRRIAVLRPGVNGYVTLRNY